MTRASFVPRHAADFDHPSVRPSCLTIPPFEISAANTAHAAGLFRRLRDGRRCQSLRTMMPMLIAVGGAVARHLVVVTLLAAGAGRWAKPAIGGGWR